MIDKFFKYLPTIQKAVIAGFAASTAAYGGAELQAGGVDGIEWAYVAAMGIGAGLLTWARRNAESPSSNGVSS
jgi:hypothetical protein